MPVIVASCANDFKHAVLTSLQNELKINFCIYVHDNANNTYAFEYYTNKHIRIVENPWIEESLGKKSMLWSNTYDSEDPQDTEINPWTIFEYPIYYSQELKEILDIGPITH